MIKVECPHCSKKLSAPPEYSGRQVTCQQCKGKFVLPDLTAAAPPSEPPAAQAAPSNIPPVSESQPIIQTESPAPQPPAQMPSVFDQVAPSSPTKPAYETPPSPEPGVFGGISQAEQERQRERRGMNTSMIEARSWTALLDIRFKKFLSPKILRVCWAIYLVMIAIWFCFASVVYVLGVISLLSIGLSQSTPTLNAPMAAASLTTPATLISPPQDIDDLFRQAQSQQGGSLFSSSARKAAGLWGFLWISFMYLVSLVMMFLAICLGRVTFESLHIFFSMADTLRCIEAKIGQQ